MKGTGGTIVHCYRKYVNVAETLAELHRAIVFADNNAKTIHKMHSHFWQHQKHQILCNKINDVFAGYMPEPPKVAQ
jgi:hypothetical protein